MLQLIESGVLNSTAALCRQFAAAQPFRHIVIDNFLDPDFCRRLIDEFPAFDPRLAVNELGETGGKAVLSSLSRIGDSYAGFDRLMRSREFLEWLAQVVSIEKLLYDPDYVGGGTHENLAGQELDFHVDFNYHPTRPLHRRLNLILFLNPEWQPDWGGCLELHQDPWRAGCGTPLVSIVPLANRCVVFETTESSWHGFRRIQPPHDKQHLTRRSLAVYFYTKQRPAAQTNPSHGTVYVPRPLPARFEPGYSLLPDDVHELQLLLARRDRQIRYLYERELKYSDTLSSVLRSPSFRTGRLLTWPFRLVRDLLRRNTHARQGHR